MIAQNTEDCDQEMMYYLMLRGLLGFQNEYNTYPGILEHDVEPDINRFKVRSINTFCVHYEFTIMSLPALHFRV